MKKFVSFFLITVMLFSSAAVFNSAAEFKYTDIASEEEWALLDLINRYRAENEKGIVTMLVGLQDASGIRSKELLTNLSHYRPDGNPWHYILGENGIEYTTDSFEIISSNYSDPESLIRALSQSPVNAEKLLGDFSHIGIGYSASDNTANSSSFCIIGIRCSYKSEYTLCNSEGIHLNYGDNTEKIDVTLRSSCSHGVAYMKVLDSMIRGYDPEAIGTKKISVRHDGAYLPFYIVNDYTDSKPGAWYYDAVLSVTDNGYFTGTGKGEFNVKGEMTRAMFVTVLGRVAGVNVSEYEGSSFPDVKAEQWYSPYVEWAAKSGVVQGDNKGRFNPNNPITRQEICVVLCNYIDKNAIELEQKNAAVEFADEDKISDWALSSVTYIQTRGIVSGNNKGQFMPRNNASRAEVAVIVDNFSALLPK